MGFLRKTLAALFSVFENEFYCERFASQHGFLQSVDARVKFLTLLFFMLFSAFSHSLVSLLLLAFTGVVYAVLSGLVLRTYLRRVWLYIPLFVLILSLPAASGFYIKGTPLFWLFGIPFTKQGLFSILRLALRAGDSLSMAYLLIITTRWPALLKALQSLHLPKTFCAVLGMAYRYIFVLCESAVNMMQSRFLRAMGRRSMEDRRFFGRGAAFLFVKTSVLSDEIYDAMLCRGYCGKVVELDSLKLTGVDILFLINNTIVIFILFLGEHLI